MRTSTLVFALALAPLFACSQPDKSSSAPKAAKEGFEDEFDQQVDAIPTQDEADADASKQINADNADAEFEKLMQELNSTPDDGG